jgi:hypothetical protein
MGPDFPEERSDRFFWFGGYSFGHGDTHTPLSFGYVPCIEHHRGPDDHDCNALCSKIPGVFHISDCSSDIHFISFVLECGFHQIDIAEW